MEAFIRATSEIIIESPNSNSVLDALYCEGIITKEEYKVIGNLDSIQGRRKLMTVLSTK